MFVVSYSCVDFFFFFETDHAVHGLPQIALCVYSRGRVGFFGVGWVFCCFEKKKKKKKSGFAVMFKFMYSFMMH